MRTRSYNTALGQFLSRDTVNDGTNFYGYVHGNPINGFDPSGHNASIETSETDNAVALRLITSTQRTRIGWSTSLSYKYIALILTGVGVSFSAFLACELVGCDIIPSHDNSGTGGGAGLGSADTGATPNGTATGPDNRNRSGKGRNDKNKSDSSKPSKDACQKAIKLLEQYERLAEKYGSNLTSKRIKKLNRKRDAGTITSNDLPGAMQREFPGEFAGTTLNEIREACKGV